MNTVSSQYPDYCPSPSPLNPSMDIEPIETSFFSDQEEFCHFPLHLLSGLPTPAYDDEAKDDSKNESDDLFLLVQAFIDQPMSSNIAPLIYAYYPMSVDHEEEHEDLYDDEAEPSFFDVIESMLSHDPGSIAREK